MSAATELEQFYDTEIAPALLELAQRSHERGLSFFAAVEWEPGETGRTAYLQQGHGFPLALANLAIQVGMNMDALIGNIVNYAKQHGHGSVYLNMLGVPLKPESKP